jgi:hypothetical protein
MKSPEAALAVVQDLIQWIYTRPQMYGRTVGEVDTAIHSLHFVWAELSERRRDFDVIRIEELERISDSPAMGIITDAERVQMIPEDGQVAIARVLDYWKAVDHRLFANPSVDVVARRDDPWMT